MSPGAVLLVSAVMLIVRAGVRAVIVLVSRVTAPLRASARPSIVVPVVTVIDVRARMLPWRVELVPSVAELPTTQKTFDAWAPLMRDTLLADAVMRVEAAWKMKTALGLPWASRVRVPVIPNVPAAELYTPGVTVVPPSSVGRVAVTGCAPASL